MVMTLMSERLSGIEVKFATLPAMALAVAKDKNQVPIIIPTKSGGESRVTADMPTGDKNNSPMVSKKKNKTIHQATIKPWLLPI